MAESMKISGRRTESIKLDDSMAESYVFSTKQKSIRPEVSPLTMSI